MQIAVICLLLIGMVASNPSTLRVGLPVEDELTEENTGVVRAERGALEADFDGEQLETAESAWRGGGGRGYGGRGGYGGFGRGYGGYGGYGRGYGGYGGYGRGYGGYGRGYGGYGRGYGGYGGGFGGGYGGYGLIGVVYG